MIWKFSIEKKQGLKQQAMQYCLCVSIKTPIFSFSFNSARKIKESRISMLDFMSDKRESKVLIFHNDIFFFFNFFSRKPKADQI